VVLLWGTPALALRIDPAGSKPSSSGKQVFPDAGVRGQELTVNLEGTTFSSGSSCSFGAGITVVSCGRGPGGQVVARLRISRSATLGYRTVVVQGAGGKAKSLPKSFRVTLAGNGSGSDAASGGGGIGGSAAGGNGDGLNVQGDENTPLGGLPTGGDQEFLGSMGGTGGTGGPPELNDIIGQGPTDTIYDGPPAYQEQSDSFTWLTTPPGDGWNDPPLPPYPPDYTGPADWTIGETPVLATQETDTSAVPGPGGLVTVGGGAVLLIALVGQRRRASPRETPPASPDR
jgi:hypothetical protein